MAEKYGPAPSVRDRPLRSKMIGGKGPLRFSLRVGEVQRVDYENMVCDIHWVQGKSPPAREVPITSGYWSKRGFLGAMPEEGSIAVCGFSAVHEDSAIRPYILCFLPNGYITARNFDPFGFAERDSEEINTPLEVLQSELGGVYGPTRHKMRKLYPGDIYGASDKGAEFILDRDARLFDNQGGEIWLRGEDQALITNTLDYFSASAAARRRSGRVIRNALTLPRDITFGAEGTIPPETALFELLVDAGLIFEDGEIAPDVNQLPTITLESGEKLTLITENLQDPTDPAVRVFTEDRVEIQEFTDQQLAFPDHYGFDADLIAEEPQWSPFIERVSGTIVGNNAYSLQGRSQYGKILKPVVFNSPTATEGQPRLEALSNNAQETEKNLAGAFLYRMSRPDGLGELFVSHDKEGHVFLSVPGSTSKKSNLGSNRSVEADFKGSIKTVIGANQNDNESINMFAKGGLKWSIGELASTRRSLDLTMKGAVGLQVREPDVDGYAWKAEMTGDVGWGIEGSMGVSVSDDSVEEAGGQMSKSAEGYELSVGTGDMNVSVTSNQNNTIAQTVTTNIGEGRKTTISKPTRSGPNAEQLRILLGNRSTTFVAPATDTVQFTAAGTRTVQAGAALSASWQTSVAGNYSFTAASGTFNVAMAAGSISMTASAVTITAAAAVNITGASVNLTGSVGLGAGAAAPLSVIGGVPGPSPYIDPLTGLPLTGNPLVRTV